MIRLANIGSFVVDPIPRLLHERKHAEEAILALNRKIEKHEASIKKSEEELEKVEKEKRFLWKASANSLRAVIKGEQRLIEQRKRQMEKDGKLPQLRYAP